MAAAVRFARDRHVENAVRGGGHNVAGTSVCDDGIVIDLSAMRPVAVDPVERTALVQGGAPWGDVDHKTQAHGLATTGGIVSHTGVGGLTLGGGIGWLMRKHGLTVDNLVEAEVVTAEGDIIQASANDHPDLFWALRGGGGNLGVVSSFRFTLHPVGPTVMAGPVFWAARIPPTSCASTVNSSPTHQTSSGTSSGSAGSRHCQLLTKTSTSGRRSPWPAATPDLSKTVSMPSVRSANLGPRSWIWSDPPCTSTIKTASTTPSPMVGAITGSHEPHPPVRRGHRHRGRARLLRDLTEVLRGDFPPGWRHTPSPRDATAYAGRNAEHNISIDAAWLPEQDETVRASETAWARAILDALQPHRAGVYVNFLDTDDDTSRVREAYGDDTYRRLADTTKTSRPARRGSDRSPHQLASRTPGATAHKAGYAALQRVIRRRLSQAYLSHVASDPSLH